MKQMAGYDDKRFEVVRELVFKCNPEGKSICDLGAGKNPISQRYNFSASKTVTVDIDEDNFPDVLHDLTRKFPFKNNSFDIVIACEILEHLHDTGFFLKEIKRILKPKGNLVMSVPNVCSMKYRLAFLLGRIPAHASKVYGYHVRDFNKSDLINTIEKHGFVVDDIKSDGTWLRGARLYLSKSLGDSIIIKATNRKRSSK